jgi:hypothetical protein
MSDSVLQTILEKRDKPYCKPYLRKQCIANHIGRAYMSDSVLTPKLNFHGFTASSQETSKNWNLVLTLLRTIVYSI